MKSPSIIMFIMAMMVLGNISLIAQEEKKQSKKKIVIIKESVDEDGTKVIEKIIKEGKAAEDFEWEEIDGLGENMRIIIDDDEIKDGHFFNFHLLDDFDGLDLLNDLDIELSNDGNHFEIKLDDGGEIFEWEGEGNIPDDVKEKLKEKNIHLFDHMDRGFFDLEDVKLNIFEEDRPFLGINLGKHIEYSNEDGTEKQIIESDGKGALIIKVFSESAAEAAGLKEGDIITKIDQISITNQEDLIEAISNYEIGDKISISYQRDGRNAQTEATLKKGNAFRNLHLKHGFDLNEKNNWKDKIVLKDRSHKVIVIRTKSDDKEEEPVKESIDIEKPATNDLSNRILELDKFEAFPNPASDQIRVKFEAQPQPITVTLSDVSGREIYRKNLNDFDGYFDQRIDLKNAPKGTLLLQIKQGKKVFSDKIILQ